MSAWTNYQGLQVGAPSPVVVRPRFSLTGDILSFRHCSRQYGYFGNDGFVPAQAVQIFYGTIVHQVLDRCHRHYSGLMNPHLAGQLPLDADIDRYFDEVENALRSHGIRPASPNVAAKARRILKLFNLIEGPILYPRVFDTEYRLESDQGQYVLRGVVDVLATGIGTTDPAQMEIWDYKGTQMPDLSSQSLQDYIWQMCVYAELYRVRSGVYPAKAILYFLNELDLTPRPTRRPPRSVFEVNFTAPMIQRALAEFHTTAQDIMACQNTQVWPNPTARPPKETCDICDIRWNCTVVPGQYPLRFPI